MLMCLIHLLRKGGVGVQDRMSFMSGAVFWSAIEHLLVQVYVR
jgi:hypothetical protein